MTARKFFATIVVSFFLGLTAIAPSAAQSPPETGDYFLLGQPVLPPIDLKACADAGRSTVGVGGSDIVEELPPPGEILNEKPVVTTGMVCPPPDIDPDIRVPALSGPGHWGHRPN